MNTNKNEIKSRAWDIEIKEGDDPKKIETKNKIRTVLKMHQDGIPSEEIMKETGFTKETITHIIVREVTFILG